MVDNICEKKDSNEYFDTTSINEKILQIWSKSNSPKNLQEAFKEPNQIAPLLYPKLKRKTLLFMGLNPSFVASSLAKTHNLKKEDVWSFYDVKNLTNKDEWIKEVEKVTGTYSYFKKFPDVTSYLNKQIPNQSFDWEHIDLLLVRKTKQNELMKTIGLDKTNDPSKIDSVDMRNFIVEQVNIMKEIIECLEPKIIVVANAKASKIFKKVVENEWNDSLGCYFSRVGEKMIQTHLTGMLTGQRAIDNETFQSLKWNIKQAYVNQNA